MYCLCLTFFRTLRLLLCFKDFGGSFLPELLYIRGLGAKTNSDLITCKQRIISGIFVLQNGLSKRHQSIAANACQKYVIRHYCKFENFARILFSQIWSKDIYATFKLRN